MAYLFLSFSEHLDKTTNSKVEFYNLSLNEQFKLLQKRLPLDKQESSFEKFIEAFFPTGMTKKYYISCPNFLRAKRQSGDDKPSFLNNVVIRPEWTISMNRYLLDGQNIILIGDIFESNKISMIMVKGIQLIDKSMSSPNDLVVQAEAVNAFTKRIVSSVSGTFAVNDWKLPRVDKQNTLLTPDFIYELIQSCFTVKNPDEVRSTYEDWKRYINFRNYYLEEQSKRHFLLDSVEYIEAYAINKKEYYRNEYLYEEYLVEKSKKFNNSEMIILSSQVEGSEPFPLIKLNIDRNRKAYQEAKISRRGKMVNEEELRIRSLASDNVFITTKNPQETQTNMSLLLNAGYALGDRFRIATLDIEPTEHLEQLEMQYENNIDRCYKRIDMEYEKKIEDELSIVVNNYQKQIDERMKKYISSEKEKLDSSLNDEVEANEDVSILKLIEKRKNELKNRTIKEIKIEENEDKQHFEERLQFEIKKSFEEINVRELYIERNAKTIENLELSLLDKVKTHIAQYKINKKTELQNGYSGDIRQRKIETKEKLDESLKKDIEKVKEDETIKRFSLYFRLGDSSNIINPKQLAIITKCKYIVYDSRAERAVIKRQEQALDNFYSGFVKNPYLSTYLFNPETLSNIQVEHTDWVWHLSSLNEKQKEAVRKAVCSNGIFLLQGPPGTGKTQVIAEIVAQLVKKGKKVLISSETHKAIDNVFERLPKIAEIVPIRLIPSTNDRKKDNEYDPKFLVDNFYNNVSSNMHKSVERYKNFKKNKEEFSETYSRLLLLKSKVEKFQMIVDAANQEIRNLDNNAKRINAQKSSLEDKKDDIKMEISVLIRTIRHIESDNLNLEDGIDAQVISDYYNELKQLFEEGSFAKLNLGNLTRNIFQIKPEEIDREVAIIDPSSKKTILEIQRNTIKDQIDACMDENYNVLPEKEEEFKSLKGQLISLNEQINKSDAESISDLKLTTIFEYSYLVKNVFDIKKIIKNLKDQILETKNKHIEEINRKLEIKENEHADFESQINVLKGEINEIDNAIIEIQERDDVKDVQESKYKLERDLIKFFKDFEISEPYNSVDEALEIIKNKWYELENNFSTKEAENTEKIPMYEKISNYLSKAEVIESDRKEFTKDLFDNANVFGITCTSNDRFSGKNVDALSEYNINDFDIKSVGIDVVIIDEVSKSSFIDLLIPILYGKTVILVGDHRQLPPIYRFSRLRDEEFEGLDETIISKEINKKFTELYEECVFKTIFEKIPESYKTRLIQQYRCHEHIMNVFNHFYQNELKIGFDGQNNSKKHNVKIISNGRNIIEPDKHVYFVDCKKHETHEQDSTSMHNVGEAKVVVELIRKLNDYFKRNPDREKLSIGVICTYGDQARIINEVRKSEKLKTDAFKTDVEKMIVSTVDDFQGDERDIIILSMVRNPENPAKSQPGFILAYQRINVALSRARRMLIIVGNRRYLESKGVIDLPDVNGNNSLDRHNFRVYEEILSTIQQYGKVIEDSDVLEEKGAKING